MWQDLIWDISAIKANLTGVSRILSFVDGGTAGTSETFYMDDVQFIR